MAWQCRIDSIALGGDRALVVGFTVYDDAAPLVTQSAHAVVPVSATQTQGRNIVLGAARALRDAMLQEQADDAVRAARAAALVGQVVAL